MVERDIIDAFQPISLEEMGKVRLMNRIDTKYVTSIDNVRKLLEAASPHYFIQQIDGSSNMPYYTRYYDTDDTMMFYQHQRGKKNRQKVRVRRYEGSSTPPFIEIKTKNNKGRTSKKRAPMVDANNMELTPYYEFLDRNSSFDPSSLIPHIENHFYRITLVDKSMTERVTIDSRLEFHNLITGQKSSLDKIGIIEWKRDGRKRDSELDRILKELRIHPCGFSKYCVGMAVTNPGLRQNRLKKKLRMIDRLNSKQNN